MAVVCVFLFKETATTEIYTLSLRDALPIWYPDPDLCIRTGGEHRVSNFLLWQFAYTELYFTDCYWPDFNDIEFQRALDSYINRQRRYGGHEPDNVAEDAGGA